MNNLVVSTDNLFKVYALSNQIIANKIKIGKYTASIKWENMEGLFSLRIELIWDSEITTLEIFEQIGLFASKVGLVSEAMIDGCSAVIRMAVAVIGREECPQTIVSLGRAIDSIIDILKRCLSPECPMISESDGLDNPNSEKSKDAAAIKAVAGYISDESHGDDMSLAQYPEMTHSERYEFRKNNEPKCRDEIEDFYKKLK
jgi:hypothetical protein